MEPSIIKFIYLFASYSLMTEKGDVAVTSKECVHFVHMYLGNVKSLFIFRVLLAIIL